MHLDLVHTIYNKSPMKHVINNTKNYTACYNMMLIIAKKLFHLLEYGTQSSRTLVHLWQIAHASFDNLNSHSPGHIVFNTKQVLGWFKKQTFTQKEFKSLFKHGDGAPQGWPYLLWMLAALLPHVLEISTQEDLLYFVSLPSWPANHIESNRMQNNLCIIMTFY